MPAANGLTGNARRQRAAVACTNCHSRKVRCNVTLSGRPCANCQQDQVECTLHVSARGKRKSSQRKESGQESRIHQPRQEQEQEHLPPPSPALLWLPEPSLGRSENQKPDLPEHEHNRPLEQLGTETEDFESNVEGYRNIMEPLRPGSSKTPFYVGELQSLRFIFHAVRESSITSSAHFLVPQAKKPKLAPEDNAFLRAKKAFSIESEQLREELIDLFFNYVYPVLPIVDPYEFFSQYELKGPSKMSPLLLQSIFLAASSYISSDGLKRSKASSIIDLKKRYYLRAKVLYDFEYESDQICLIQSLLLMGYWYGNTHEKADSWHWVGTAISLSQTLGLNRDPGQSKISTSQRRLWRRIWWCCFYRDRYLALGMGRPMRINPDDCDIRELVLNDLISHSALGELSTNSAATVQHCDKVAPLFLEMVKMTHILGRILVCQYRPVPPPSATELLQKYDEELQSWYLHLDVFCQVDTTTLHNACLSTETVHKHFLQITFHLIVITLFKPLIFRGNVHQDSYGASISSNEAWRKCLLSASAAMDNLRRLVEIDLVKYLPPEIVTALISIVSILFLDRLWATGLKRDVATQKVDLAMLIVRELGEKYMAARFFISYFTAAFQKVNHEHRTDSLRVNSPMRIPANGNFPEGLDMPSEICSWTLPWNTTQDSLGGSASLFSPTSLFPDVDIFTCADIFSQGQTSSLSVGP